MAKKITWSKEWWEEWQNKPTKETAEKWGLPWSEVPTEWKNETKWQNMSQEQGKQEIQRSKWSSWFWWD